MATRWDRPGADGIFDAESKGTGDYAVREFAAESPERTVATPQVRLVVAKTGEADIIEIPAKRELGTYRKSAHDSDPLQPTEIAARLAEVQPVPTAEQAVWDATMAEYHPMGFRRTFGADKRYRIYGTESGEQVVLETSLFAAAARNVAPRDRWPG